MKTIKLILISTFFLCASTLYADENQTIQNENQEYMLLASSDVLDAINLELLGIGGADVNGYTKVNKCKNGTRVNCSIAWNCCSDGGYCLNDVPVCN